MDNPSTEAQANLELILNQVRVLCKGVRFSNRVSKQGRPPKYPNWYILQLMVIQYFLGFNSERSYLRFLKQLNLPALAELPDQSLYNRRVKKLKPLVKSLTKKLLNELRVEKSKIRILDATPVPVVKYSRAKRRKIFLDKNLIGIGYCSSQKTYFCGAKLNLLVNQDGIPCQTNLIAGNRHDVGGLRQFMEDKLIKSLVVVADKGYIIKSEEKQILKQKKLIRLITPYRRNQRKNNSEKEKQLLKKRKIIETVISQLKDQMRLEHLRTKTYEGLVSRIDNILFTYIFGVYFNKLTNRNPLNLKSILT